MSTRQPFELEQEINQLKHEVEEYRQLFDSIPIMFWYKDMANRVVRINEAAAKLEGTTVGEMEGKSCYQLYPKEQAEAFYQDDLRVIESGEPELNIIEEHTSVKTGEKFWLQTGKVPYYSNRGDIAGVVAFAVDITPQREAEQKLQRTHELFRSTVEQLKDAVQRGADTSELMTYLKSIEDEFEKLDAE